VSEEEEERTFPHLKDIVTRVSAVVLCTVIAFYVPNIGQFLNFQGALTGTLISFVFPICCFIKTFGYSEITWYERQFSLAALLFGIIGGSIATLFAFEALIA